jgi:hypothetical protein
MSKRKSTHETKNMIQTAVWLPRDMHERLKNEGASREGLGEEIRRRIQMSFDAEDAARDEITRELLDEIRQVAIASSTEGRWYTNCFTFNVFKAAADALISRLEPKNAPGMTARLQKLYGTDAKAETVGRILAGVFLSRHPDDYEPTRLDWSTEGSDSTEGNEQ